MVNPLAPNIISYTHPTGWSFATRRSQIVEVIAAGYVNPFNDHADMNAIAFMVEMLAASFPAGLA